MKVKSSQLITIMLMILFLNSCASKDRCLSMFSGTYEGVAFLIGGASLHYSLNNDCTVVVDLNSSQYKDFEYMYNKSTYNTVIRPIRVKLIGSIQLNNGKYVMSLHKVIYAREQGNGSELNSASQMLFGDPNII